MHWGELGGVPACGADPHEPTTPAMGAASCRVCCAIIQLSLDQILVEPSDSEVDRCLMALGTASGIIEVRG